MPYIQRSPTGAIDSLHRHRVAGTDEFLPAEAQAKLFARNGFREWQSQSWLHLFAPSGSTDVI